MTISKKSARSLAKMLGMAGAVSSIALAGGAVEINQGILDLYGITENDLKTAAEIYRNIGKQLKREHHERKGM